MVERLLTLLESPKPQTVDKIGGVPEAISAGTSPSRSHTVNTRSDTVASTVGAGGEVTISACGDAQHSDVTVQGSQITAA